MGTISNFNRLCLCFLIVLQVFCGALNRSFFDPLSSDVFLVETAEDWVESSESKESNLEETENFISHNDESNVFCNHLIWFQNHVVFNANDLAHLFISHATEPLVPPPKVFLSIG